MAQSTNRTRVAVERKVEEVTSEVFEHTSTVLHFESTCWSTWSSTSSTETAVRVPLDLDVFDGSETTTRDTS